MDFDHGRRGTRLRRRRAAGTARREPRQVTLAIRMPLLLTVRGNASMVRWSHSGAGSTIGEVGKIIPRRVAGGSLAYPPASLLGRLSERTREDFLAVGVSESRPAGM